MKNIGRKILSIVLSILLVIGMVPLKTVDTFAKGDLSINTSIGSMMVLTNITIKNINGEIVESTKQQTTIQLNEDYEEINVRLTGTKKGGPANMPLTATMKYSLNGGVVSGFTANGQTSGYADIGIKPQWNTDSYTAEIKISEPGGGGTYKLVFIAPVTSSEPVESIMLSKNTESVFVGESTKITTTVIPSDASQQVEWKSSDTTVATVDKDGVITGIKAGNVTISATTKGKDINGNLLSATCNLTVKNIDVTDITLNKSEITVAKGYTESLSATVLPNNATIKDVKWASSDETIATVDGNGKVKGIKDGTVDIVVTSLNNPTVTKSCKVNVVTVKVNEIKLNKDTASVDIGYSTQLEATVKPDNAANKKVIWTSSDETVAEVDGNGKVTGISTGSAIITAKSEDNQLISASCTVTVNKVDVQGISLDKTELDLFVRDTVTLKGTVSPENATEKGLIWESSNESIIKVDQNGLITAVKEGEATITVKSKENPSLQASCRVNASVLLEKDIPTSCVSAGNFDTWLSNLNVKGADVVQYVWNIEKGHTEKDKHILYVQLSDDTRDDAKLKLSYTLSHSNKTRKGSISAPTEVTLENGKATITAKTTAYSNNWLGVGRTYEIQFSNKLNHVPEVKQDAISEVTKEIGETFEISLNDLFIDIDNDSLHYFVTKDGVKEEIGELFTMIVSESKNIEITFEAVDIWGNSVSHVILLKSSSSATYDVAVEVPEDINPRFYIIKDIVEGKDVLGDELSYLKGETNNGLTVYTVNVPESLSQITLRDKNWGGRVFDTKDANGSVIDEHIRFVKVQTEVNDIFGNVVDGTITISNSDYYSTKGNNGYLLLADYSYTITAVPNDTNTYVIGIKNVEIGTDKICVVIGEVALNNPIEITAPSGAESELYLYKQYYSNQKYESFGVKDNGNGTSTTYFINAKIPNGGGSFIYRVKYEDYIVKAGWTSKSVTVTFNENDPKYNTRVDYKTSGSSNASFAEDNVLLNINGQNNLVMSKGTSKTIKAYRAWEIIPVSYNNFIITPDFHYNIISGSDVIQLTDKASLSTTDTDWKTITAIKNGTAIIEVSYDAIEVSGSISQLSGIYGATDPARTGLMVVQVGGHADVDFGINGFSSQGNLEYTKSSKKAWDAEFDTLYFVGENGELELAPKAKSGSVQKVEVSADKGNSWKTLTGTNGVYKAPIAHGNNIIRVTTDQGEAYQVVRGYKVNVTFKVINDNGNGVVDAGETVRVMFDSIHQPIPKMAGNYNPGYRNNDEGDGGTHIRYTFNGQTVSGAKVQYNVPLEGNYIDVTIPKETDETSFTLSNGYIATGVIGLTSFADGGDSHRNIPDSGCSTRGSKTTFHTRSMLPDVTIHLGGSTSPNSAPYVKGDAILEAQIELEQTYALNPEGLFKDNEGDILTFIYSVNGIDKGEADKNFKFTPDSAGEYELTFIASDGKLTAQHTLTLIVTEKTDTDNQLHFNIPESSIKGYVTVGFEDFGVRDENAYGLKYPEALGTIIENTKVPFADGDSIAEVTIRLLDALGIGYEYTGTVENGFYLGAIKNFIVNNIPYDSLGQYDAGEGSGWMISSNDWFIDKGASEFNVADGDTIQWKYTCQLGSDIGDNSWEKVVGEVEKLIDAIEKPITLECIDQIETARDAYNELSSFHQSKVSNYDKLLEAERIIEELIKDSANNIDKQAAKEVDKLIEQIGKVTLESADKIKKAREAYEKLTSLQKQLVTRLDDLEKAENIFKQLNNISHKEVYETTGNYMLSLGTPYVGSIGGEWMAIGLGRGNKDTNNIADKYYKNVIQFIENKFNNNNELKETVRLNVNKSTENSRVILGLTALGYDATNVNGYNLFNGLDDMEYIKYQGINGPIWALIALNSHPNYKDELKNVTENLLINEILSVQLADGGWDLLKKSADADMTAMAIQALAPYYNTNIKVKLALDKAIEKLSSMQLNDGSFASVDGKNCESTAQVVVALTSLGINPEEDVRFIKKGLSAVDALCEFAVQNGGFMHTLGTKVDGMATEQGYYALVSYFRLLNNQNSLYNMEDITLHVVVDNDQNSNTNENDRNNNEQSDIINNGQIVVDKNLVKVNDKLENVTKETSYDDSLDVLLQFLKLDKTQQSMISNQEQIEIAKNNVAKNNHTDVATGVNITGVEWNIKLHVEGQIENQLINNISNKLDKKEILVLWDIHLKDVVTGKKYNVENVVEIKIPKNLVKDYEKYDYFKIVHYTDDGRIELLNCDTEGQYIVFDTVEFSLYGIVGFMNDEGVPDYNAYLWSAVAGSGLLVLAFIIMKKYKYREVK